ncbi:hypothetical protein HMPREF2137_03700 [Hoylesella buccalis DNF00853]|uniref:Uncharacterized protein n=1 Tax=Hoylesella buccalis DNF00853 TaxID=1401074 RepID=A0A095ZM46_9BACT|nr:hypothetical protein HMPREF2137_03700 [Hoylesella buccalis DNF00853]
MLPNTLKIESVDNHWYRFVVCQNLILFIGKSIAFVPFWACNKLPFALLLLCYCAIKSLSLRAKSFAFECKEVKTYQKRHMK